MSPRLTTTRCSLVLRSLLVASALAAGCSDGSSGDASTTGSGGTSGSGDGGASASGTTSATATGTTTGSGSVTTGEGGGSAQGPGGTGGGASGEPCGCLLGEGPYCAGRIEAEAEAQGCTTPFVEGHEGDLLSCEGDVWTVLEECAGTCDYDPEVAQLDDHCVLPECECFVQVAWCGSGAAKEAEEMGCQIPLLPEHNGDILYCPGGVWDVKQPCEQGCVEAPSGTPDFCKSDSEYLLPFPCDAMKTCSSGNHTSNHDGKDEYAYDFATPVGTSVRAMRDGTVLRVRNVSTPGDGCYSGGGSSCANYANTVEVLHSDGTVALYMHLNQGTALAGDPVAQGDELGKSGNSGWSTGPHLHVQVQEDCGIWWCQSLPFKFIEDPTVSTGTTVTSDNDCR
jgi:hypothetical protein